MPIELISFDKGINRKKSPLLLTEGEVYTVSGFSFKNDGQLVARDASTVSYAIDTDAVINGMHRYGTNLLSSAMKLCPGDLAYFNYIYHRTTSDTSNTNIDLLSGSTRLRFADYDKFIFVVDGESKRAYSGTYDYEWGIDNPTSAPGVDDSGVAGNPDGEYTCYYTWYITFPNTKVYETGPSPSASVTVSSMKITWNLPVCPNFGDGTTVEMRLYRTVSGIAYYVDKVSSDATSYTDNELDETLQGNSILSTTEYGPPPSSPTDVAIHLQRAFVIKENKLYYTDPYMPWAFIDGGEIVVTKEDESLTGLIVWSEQLYIPSRYKWYRLQGSSDDTWSIKQTFTDSGVINKHTMVKTRFGIPGLWYDGIYLFDGATNKNLTEKYLGKQYFDDIDDLDDCWAFFDGLKYYFYHTVDTVDKCLVLDFSYYPDLRWYFDTPAWEARTFDPETGTHYLADSGYEYTISGTESITTSIRTGDYAFKDITKRKALRYFWYDINTGGVDVTVTVYVDGTSTQTYTINTSSRVRKREETLSWKCEGYRFSLGIDCTNSSAITIYSPWGLEADYVGV